MFVVVVLVIARWRGLFAILGLAFGGAVVWWWMLPALLDGSPGVGVALALFVVIVLGAVVLIFRIPMRPFYRHVREPFLIAFSTASSML